MYMKKSPTGTRSSNLGGTTKYSSSIVNNERNSNAINIDYANDSNDNPFERTDRP